MDDDVGLYDCPMPEPFGENLGLTIFLLPGYVIWSLSADRNGQKVFMCLSLRVAAPLTIALGIVDGGLIVATLFLQLAVLTAFFPAAYGALARVNRPRCVRFSVPWVLRWVFWWEQIVIGFKEAEVRETLRI